jgi:processive 1,2-diacylglycerol beta-glucosyltransferase
MRVLILSCGTGGGHNAAANAMKEAFEMRGHQADVLNPYTLKTNKLANIIDTLYVRLVQISPTLFGFAYKIGATYRRLPWRSPVYFANAEMVPVMEQYLAKNHYDAIMMPHLFPAEIITQMKDKGIALPPTIFVATDYVCIPFTEETDCDAYVIPSRHVRQDFLRRGIPEKKLKALGIPVRQTFAQKISKEKAREQLGLEPDTFYTLVCAGSMGAGGILKTIKVLYRWCKKQNRKLEKRNRKEQKKKQSWDNLQSQTKLIIICGNNKVLYDALHKILGGDEHVILTGFTDQMALYMKASDVCITKPGGLSSTEAAVANVPFIHAMAIPGCETQNLDFFESCGMSIGVRKSHGELIRAIKRLQNRQLQETMKLAQKKFVRPNSGEAICRLTEKLVRADQTQNRE